MRKTNFLFFVSILVMAIPFKGKAQTGGVTIGTNQTPHGASILDVISTTKGVSFPQVDLTTTTTLPAGVTPKEGTLIYNTQALITGATANGKGLYYWDGTQWVWMKNNAIPDAWLINGNTGTNGNTHFLGTIDDQPLKFRINNTWAGTLSKTTGTAYGYLAMPNSGSPTNTAIGNNALTNMHILNSGGGTIQNNSAIGAFALFSCTTGANNTAIGSNALTSLTTGNENMAIGYNTLSANIAGQYNTAIGNLALQNTTADRNTAIGYGALLSNQTGIDNVAIGIFSLLNNTATSNTGVGTYTLRENTTGSQNAAVGWSALVLNTTGTGNTAVGFQSSYWNTAGNFNTSIGTRSQAYTLGSGNVGIGYEALQAKSFNDPSVGDNNVAIGFQSMFFNKTAASNTAIGYQSLYQDSIGNNNTAIGYTSLFTNKVGNDNIAVGYGADINVDGLNNTIVIGTNVKVNASNTAQIGNSAITDVYFGNATTTTLHAAATVTPSDMRLKKSIQANVPGLNFVKLLRPVTYTYTADKANKIHSGFIAQEVEKAAQQAKYDFGGLQRPDNTNKYYSLNLQEFLPSLVKSVQELEDKVQQQQKESEALKAELKKQQDMIDTLMKEVQLLKSNNK